uniref:Prefoldin subunit 3 n=2 Tax=Parascaris univalens TaxID=6257 RepID=A0A914ZTY3_PARUN
MANEKRTSKRGIPEVKLLEDVEAYLKREGGISADAGVKRIENSYRTYKIVEQQMLAQKARVALRMPDLKHSLEMLAVIEQKAAENKPLEVTHLLSDQVYCHMTAEKLDTVYLWLGANVMVEFTIEEARKVLKESYDQAAAAVDELNAELDFVKDQITTTEVNMAHVYNYGVQMRKANANAVLSSS